MIIGYDAKRALFNSTGLGNYSRLVIEAMSTCYPKNQYFLYTPSMPDSNRYVPSLATMGSLKQPHSRQLSLSWWRSGPGILKDLHRHYVQVYHGLSGELPLGIGRDEVRSVVTIHDLIFKRYPRYYKPIDRLIYDWKARHACRVADSIVAVSQFTKDEIVHYYGIDPEKIKVVYQGCAAEFHQAPNEAHVQQVLEKYELPKRFMLMVGTIEERKNMLLAVQALPLIDDKQLKLVVVGRRTPYYKKVKHWAHAHGVLHRIARLPHVHQGDLPVIYHLAQLTAYVSRCEGFGIPIVESQSLGIPVVAADVPALHEAGGDAALYVDPDSPQQLAQAVNSLLQNPDLRAQVSAAGLENVKRFDPVVMADKLNDIYHQVRG